MTANICPITGETLAPDRYISVCGIDQVKTQLLDIPDLLRELDVVLTRRTRYMTPGLHDASKEQPLPYNPAASELKHQTLRALCAQLDNLIDAGLTERLSPYTPIATFHYAVIIKLHQYASRPDAASRTQTIPLTETINTITRRLTRAIDSPPDLEFIGICAVETAANEYCGNPLYVKPGAATTRCNKCCTTLNTADVRDYYLALASDYTAPIPQLLQALKHTHIKLNKSTIYTWINRNQLQHAYIKDGRKHYRLGDLINLATRLDSKRCA